MEDNRVFKDENKGIKEELSKDQPEDQTNNQTQKSKFDRFFTGYLIMLLLYAGMFFYDRTSAIAYIFLFAIVGFILWAVIKGVTKKRKLGLTPSLAGLLVLFIFTGGCGLLVRG